MVLKFYEIRNKHDYYIFSIIAFFSITASALLNQTLIPTIFLFINTYLIFSLLYRVENQKSFEYGKVQGLSKEFYKYLALSLPFIILLFLLFPRFNIGFRFFNPKMSKTGFSDKVEPTKVNDIFMSDEVAFRVWFNNKIPKTRDMYWIGTVLYRNRGFDFYPNHFTTYYNYSGSSPSKDIKYTVSTELMTLKYFFTLDTPNGNIDSPVISHRYDDKTYRLLRTFTNKMTYSATSTTKPRPYFPEYIKKLSSEINKKQFSKKTLNLVESLKTQDTNKTIRNIINYFLKNRFKYTLSPGPTPTLESFLFNKKLGFCMHYASAMTILARLSGIPARVVVGYQGGEYNDLGDYYIIRQKDAHAWSEIYIKGEGWKRIDLVEYIEPGRISLGGNEFFSSQDEVNSKNSIGSTFKRIFRQSRLLFDLADAKWSTFLNSFDQEFQFKLAKKLKIPTSSLYNFALAIPVLLIIVFLLINKYLNLSLIHI